MIEFIFFKQSSVLGKIYHVIIDMVQNNFILKRQFFLFSLFLFENLPNIEIFGGSQLTFNVSYDQHLNCEVSSWRGRHFLFSSPGPAGVASCSPPPLAVTFLLSLINHLLVIVFCLPCKSFVPFLRAAPDKENTNLKNYNSD